MHVLDLWGGMVGTVRGSVGLGSVQSPECPEIRGSKSDVSGFEILCAHPTPRWKPQRALDRTLAKGFEIRFFGDRI